MRGQGELLFQRDKLHPPTHTHAPDVGTGKGLFRWCGSPSNPPGRV